MCISTPFPASTLISSSLPAMSPYPPNKSTLFPLRAFLCGSAAQGPASGPGVQKHPASHTTHPGIFQKPLSTRPLAKPHSSRRAVERSHAEEDMFTSSPTGILHPRTVHQ
jgi:hypothetical protein